MTKIRGPGVVTSYDIKDGGVETVDIKDAAVTNDKIASSTITYDKLAANTIYILVTLTLGYPGSVAADSTGVKFESAKVKTSARHLKKLRVRAKVSDIPSDATIRIEIYDYTAGTVLGYVEFSGSTGESEAEVTSGWTDGNLIGLRVNVTTASATSGATATIDYVILEAEYGIS